MKCRQVERIGNMKLGKVHTGNFIAQTILILMLTLVSAVSQAQEIKFTATASKTRLAVGEQFRVTFTVNAAASSFSPPDLSNFDIYTGPNQSSSVQIINGNISQSLSYSYVIAAKREGKFSIGPASIQVGNGRISSNVIEVEVKAGAAAQAQVPNQGNQSGQGNDPGNNLFIRAIVDKTSAYIGEQIQVTYKIYSRYNQLSFSDVKFPTFNGFYSEEVQNGKNDRLIPENYEGTTYYTAELKRTILLPQMSGKLELPSLDATIIVRERAQAQNFWEQVMGGGYRDVPMKVRSRALSINVLPYPSSGKPANFKGAVGQLSMSVSADKTQLKSGDALTLKVQISGKGNLKLIDDPGLTFPPEFEVYDPQTTDQIRVSENGINGSRIFEYLLIPRAGGKYKLGPFSFSYFNPQKKSFQTITEPEIEIDVEKTAGEQVISRSGSQSALKQIASDIRFNKTSTPDFKPADESVFFNSVGFWILAILPPILLIILLIAFRKREQRKELMHIYRSKSAGSVAQKRLKTAKQLLDSNNTDAFYEEVFRVINGYLRDKLQLNQADLTRERVRSELSSRNVSDEDITELLRLIEVSEFARFAQGAQTEMSNVYQQVSAVITRLNNILK